MRHDRFFNRTRPGPGHGTGIGIKPLSQMWVGTTGHFSSSGLGKLLGICSLMSFFFGKNFQKFESLRNHARCSNYFHGLLDFVEHGLLVVKEDQRTTCDKLRERFQEMHDKCMRDPAYCTERGPHDAVVEDLVAASSPTPGAEVASSSRRRDPSSAEEDEEMPPPPLRTSPRARLATAAAAAGAATTPALESESSTRKRETQEDLGGEEPTQKLARHGP